MDAVEVKLEKLRHLEAGWDGHRADPVPSSAIDRALYLWSQIKGRIKSPFVGPTSGGCIGFEWSEKVPDKDLLLWIHGEPELTIEYSIDIDSRDEVVAEGSTTEVSEILPVIDKYLAI